MEYKEAVEEMKALAKGGIWTLFHETASYHDIQIHGYIAEVSPYHAVVSATYAGAIENVKRMLGLVGSDPAPEDGSEMEIPVLKPITTPVRELDPAVIEETITKTNEEYQRRGE